MKKILFPVVFIGLLFFISCSSSKVQNDVSNLTSNQWNLVSISGKTLDANANSSGVPYMTFAAGNVFKGFTGCNIFMGTYKLSNGKLSLDPGSITKMFCTDAPETEYLIAIGNTTGYKISGGELVLLNGTTELMKFVSKTNN
jgi:heat shock protein HslJ